MERAYCLVSGMKRVTDPPRKARNVSFDSNAFISRNERRQVQVPFRKAAAGANVPSRQTAWSRKRRDVHHGNHNNLLALLLRHTHGLAAAAGRARVLATNTKAIGVTNTTVSTNLLHALEIVAQLDVDNVGRDMLGLAGLRVALTIEEPRRNLVLQRIGDDVGDALELLGRQGASAAGDVDASLLADQVGEAHSDTLDHTKGEGNLALAVDVRVQQTHDVLKAVGCHGERHLDGGPRWRGLTVW